MITSFMPLCGLRVRSPPCADDLPIKTPTVTTCEINTSLDHGIAARSNQPYGIHTANPGTLELHYANAAYRPVPSDFGHLARGTRILDVRK